MIKALKEYNEMVWKPSLTWMKRHWKGYSVFFIVCVVVEYVWLFVRFDSIKEYVKSKFKKNKDES